MLQTLRISSINGTKLAVEDFRQELSCNINIKHREEFDEEKEPDKMVSSGWSALVEGQINSNGENKSTASSCAHSTDDTIEDPSTKPGMKRKLGEMLEIKENYHASSSA
ncbi:unnamed protein product [Triticum turgidum subsp. durum]|uniref:Uncharacterized protein n=1 Tax=Triticum turgidum subsp. durum TaxID=4567 RepID=A0A9R1BD33_TRITD|nr:unnamed protein product [Triticum turgidum subsp. durum]